MLFHIQQSRAHVSNIFLYRFWPIPSISSTQAQSIRMWLWLPGTLHLTLSIYTRYAFILVIKCCCCLNRQYNKLCNPPFWLLSHPPHICRFFTLPHDYYSDSDLLTQSVRSQSFTGVGTVCSINLKKKKKNALHLNSICMLHVASSLNGFNYFAPFHYVGIFKAPSSVFIDSPFNFHSLIIELLALKMSSD